MKASIMFLSIMASLTLTANASEYLHCTPLKAGSAAAKEGFIIDIESSRESSDEVVGLAQDRELFYYRKDADQVKFRVIEAKEEYSTSVSRSFLRTLTKGSAVKLNLGGFYSVHCKNLKSDMSEEASAESESSLHSGTNSQFIGSPSKNVSIEK